MPAVGRLPTEERFTLYSADWPTYLKFLEAVGDRPIRINYDRGKLEIMSPSRKHDLIKSLLGRMLEIYMMESRIEFEMGGSMTFKREDLDRGCEPDECYWIANCAAVEGTDEYDPAVHPPPDLIVEVDVTRSSIDRMGLFAAMGVPEVWRWFDKGRLTIYRLADGEYAPVESSPTFPSLPVAEVVRHLRKAAKTTSSKLLRAFRKWVREQASG